MCLACFVRMGRNNTLSFWIFRALITLIFQHFYSLKDRKSFTRSLVDMVPSLKTKNEGGEQNMQLELYHDFVNYDLL